VFGGLDLNVSPLEDGTVRGNNSLPLVGAPEKFTLMITDQKKAIRGRTHWFANGSLPGERNIVLVGSPLPAEHVFQFVHFLRQVDLGQGGSHDFSQVDHLEWLVGFRQCRKRCRGRQGVSRSCLLKQELNRQLVCDPICRRLRVNS
jgi:hypothetical protein